MWDSTIARSNEELVKTNAVLVKQVAELNSRVAEQLQVERKNTDLALRVKELEGAMADVKRENRNLSSDKFALEQEVKLGGAQRAVQRMRMVVKVGTVVPASLLILFSFGSFLSSVFGAIDHRTGFYLLFGSAPGLYLLTLSARPTEARSIRIICAFVLNDIGNPLFPSPKHIFLVTAIVFARPSTCPIKDDVETCTAFSLVCIMALLCSIPPAIAILPRTLRRKPGSGPWRHMLMPGTEDVEWARQEWGPLATSILGKVAPFVVWAAAQDARGNFVTPPRSALLMLWRFTRLVFALLGTLIMVAPFAASALIAVANGSSSLIMPTMQTVVDFLMAGAFILLPTALLTEGNRGRYHALLAKLASFGQAGKAAGIAALVGKSDPARTLQLARRNFRGVHFSDLVQESFVSSADSGLNEKATRYRLGEIDAFLSHSWHDDPVAKWQTLLRWAREFEAKHRRTPSLWLDKASIDQQDIAAQLACLPVWLAGCNSMLICAGPTFVQRLWCVIEVFTFLRLGSGYDHLTLLPIEGGEDGGREAAELQVYEGFRTFDVRRAMCFREEERQHLLSVVEAGFGDLDVFNSLVRHLFTNRLVGDEMTSTTRRASTRRASRSDASPVGARTAKPAGVPVLGVGTTDSLAA